MSKKDYQNPQTENSTAQILTVEALRRELQQNENLDKNHHQQFQPEAQYQKGIEQLYRIFSMLRSEAKADLDSSATSFACVEKEIAKCISECLQDVPPYIHDIDSIQSLLKDYKVIQFDSDQNPSVSLHRIHVILQDNYKDSSLCRLFNICITGFMGINTKVIVF